MNFLKLFIPCFFCFIVLTSEDCEKKAVSASGVSKANTTVNLDLNGNTVEQNHVIERLKEDNLPGAIKHLYIVSLYSGDVILYSTVKGKVTSSGKRLSPSTASRSEGSGTFQFSIGNGDLAYTNEVLGDDGTYGPSVEYIYWWDTKNIYHQQYVTGGMLLHISSQPIAVKHVILNLETSNNE